MTSFFFFFFNDTATTEIYTLSLHDALPIYRQRACRQTTLSLPPLGRIRQRPRAAKRSEEHTSELQSPCNLVCRLLLEKKKNTVPARLHNVDSGPQRALYLRVRTSTRLPSAA